MEHHPLYKPVFIDPKILFYPPGTPTSVTVTEDAIIINQKTDFPLRERRNQFMRKVTSTIIIKNTFQFEVLPGEIWKLSSFRRFRPFYVSSYGRFCTSKGILMPVKFNDQPYIHVYSRKTGRKWRKPADKIVATTFLGRQKGQVIHQDGDLLNNYLDNLYWS